MTRWIGVIVTLYGIGVLLFVALTLLAGGCL